jgi:hypothetical protein
MNLADVLSLGGDVGNRLRLVGLLPGAVFVLVVAGLVSAGAPDDAPSLHRALEAAGGLDGWQGALLALLVAVAALLLQPLQLGLVRLLEGYWDAIPLLRRLTARARRRQLAEVARLRDLAAPRPNPSAEDRAAMVASTLAHARRFPARDDDVLPTALGNALRAAETRGGEPYGLAAITAWPRMYPLLPGGTRDIVDDQRDQLDVAARFCAVFAALAVTVAVLLAQHPAWLLLPLAFVVLAWLAYRAAIAAAIAYGTGIRVAIDLHRFDLLRALHLPLPATHAEEVALNQQLSRFLLQDVPVEAAYEH